MDQYKKFTSVAEAVKELGEVKALATLNHGHRDKTYRAERQQKIQARTKRLLELEQKMARGEVVEQAKRKTA